MNTTSTETVTAQLGSHSSADIVERLNKHCVGHPYAKIEWPHRLLHDARDEIVRLRASLQPTTPSAEGVTHSCEPMEPEIAAAMYGHRSAALKPASMAPVEAARSLDRDVLASMFLTMWKNGNSPLQIADEILLRFTSAAQGWRDISTAPRDGTLILICGFSPEYFVADVKWDGGWMLFDTGTDGWTEPCFAATHWQPLPTPPLPSTDRLRDEPDVTQNRDGTTTWTDNAGSETRPSVSRPHRGDAT